MDNHSSPREQDEKRMRDFLLERYGIKTDEDFRRRYREFIHERPHINLAIFTTGGPYDNYGNNRSRAALG